MKHVISLIAVIICLFVGLNGALVSAADKNLDATAAPLLVLSQSCLNFNFKSKDATMGMSWGAEQFNAGEMLTITGEAPFTVQITPGGNSYPATSFTYKFIKAGAYSIKVTTLPDTGIPQHFEVHCTIPQPLPAGNTPSPTPILAKSPISLSHSCNGFNFKGRDAVMGMGFGSQQFNAGETLTITGEAPFTVQIMPGGNSYPATSFTYKFPKTGIYSIKVMTLPDTGIPQRFDVQCTIPQPLPAGKSPTPTPILAASPISLSSACNGFNFNGKDMTTGMGFGAKQFNAGETLTITGETTFTVEITPGGTSAPATSYTYKFPKTGTYSIKVVSSPKGVSQRFDVQCTIPQPQPAGKSPASAVSVDAKVCQPFKFVSVKPYGPARIAWSPANHAALTDSSSQVYWYRVIITALTNDQITLPLVDGWINESTQPETMQATFPYSLPSDKRIQSYTVMVVAGSGSADYPDHQDDGEGYLNQDCTISMILLATLPTPIPPTATAVPTQAPQVPQQHSQPQAPQPGKPKSCPPGTTGDPSKGIPCIAVPK